MSKIILSTIALCYLICLAAGCQASSPACPPVSGTPVYLSIAPELLPTPTMGMGPFMAKVGGAELQVDKIVQGALCNDNWSGTVYVTCDVQVYPWVENPTFLKECQLNIDPQAVVYVAYHNDSAYYKGCSCHTGETPQP